MTTAKQARFQFGFMLMMIGAGRNNEASVAADKVYAYLKEQAELEDRMDELREHAKEGNEWYGD